MPETKKSARMYSIALILLILTITIGLLLNPLFTGRLIEEIRSPSLCSGYWSSCVNAFADDSSRSAALAKGDIKKSGIWRNYNLLIPQSATIEKVSLRADFFASASNGYANIKISNDEGRTYGPSHIIGGNTAERSYLIDLTNDRNWSSFSLTNLNLVVNATCFKQGGGKNPYCYLDWLPINVSYTPFDFSLSISPSGNSVSQGSASSALVSISSLGGISQSVSLSHTGCPSAATCSLSPSTGNPPFSSQLSISTSSSTPIGEYLITIIGSGDGKTRSTGFVLNVTTSTNETQNITLPPPPTNTSSSCTDTDGGKDYYTKGTTSSPTLYWSSTDICYDPRNLSEGFCTPDGKPSTEKYPCPNGCAFGVCINGNLLCSDSDGGKNYYVAGTVTESLGSDSRSNNDICQNFEILYELYCDANNRTATQTYNCSTNCFNNANYKGACTNPNLKCIDSDGGLNYYTTGTTSVGDLSKTDQCGGTGYLSEYYCDTNNSLASKYYFCPYGCPLWASACKPQNDTCIDSDGGKNWNVKGTTTQANTSRTDFCAQLSTGLAISEYYCDANGNIAQALNTTCSCVDGACV